MRLFDLALHFLLNAAKLLQFFLNGLLEEGSHHSFEARQLRPVPLDLNERLLGHILMQLSVSFFVILVDVLRIVEPFLLIFLHPLRLLRGD